MMTTVGGETADTRFRTRRRIRADHPADPVMGSAFELVAIASG
jgi:hypothetical protein